MLFEQAVAEHRNGNLAKAETLYRQILSQTPDNFDVLHMLAVVCSDTGKVQESEDLFRRALSIDTKFPPCFHNFGLLLAKRKEYRKAIEQFDKALALFPGYAPVYADRGLALKELGRLDDALENLNKAISLGPNIPDFRCVRGDIHFRKKDFSAALKDYDDALVLNANLATAWCGRGNAYVELKRYDDASAAFDKALTARPDLPEAWYGRANAHYGRRRYEEAIAAYDRALALKPDFPAAWLTRGNVLIELSRLDQALAAYDKALTSKPDLAEAWQGRGCVHFRSRRYDEALAAHDKALTFSPDLAEALTGRGDALLALNRVDEAIASYDRAIGAKPDYAVALSNKIFALDFSPTATIADQQQARSLWWTHIGKPLADAADTTYRNARLPERRLVIGYVSADFRQHSAAFCFRPVVCNHDRIQFEVVCYSSNLQEDDFTRSFRNAADRWRDVFRMSDEELARQIRADGVDILVDLSGHSEGTRLQAFARKPAPIQVTAWGHCTGTGLRTIQYLFSDPVMTPQSARPLFAETIYDLPCAIIVEDLPPGVPRGELPALKNGYCTFGAFNRTTKISDDSIRMWARILAELPDARLVLKDGGLDSAPIRSALLAKFSGHDIAANRIECLGFTRREAHLAAYNKVDICLDPFPQNSGISAWEALRMGVPVVAKLGTTLSSRVCGAVLTSVGLSEWVAEDDEGYLAIALKNARRLNEIAALRNRLPAIVAGSPAGNTAAYRGAVEAAYRDMWRKYCRS